MKEWVIRIVLLVISLIFILIFIELGLKYFYPQYDCLEFGQYDSTIGWTIKPNYNDVCISLGHETVTDIKTNSLGLRDVDVEIPKPPNVFRILVLGDSMTFGIGVEQERVYTEVLEELLNKNDGIIQEVEVINSGVPGYGTGQALLLYEELSNILEPDLVILGFLVTNDVIDNLCLDGDPNRPCFYFESDATSISLKPPTESNEEDVSPSQTFSINNLHSYVFLKTRLEKLVSSQPFIIQTLNNLGIMPVSRFSPLLHSWYGSESFEDGWKLTSTILEKLKQSVESDEATLVVLILPGRPQTTSGYYQTLHALYENTAEGILFNEIPTRPQDLMIGWGFENGIVTIDPLADLKAAAGNQSINLLDGHFNANGNHVVGQSLYDAIMQENLLKINENTDN